MILGISSGQQKRTALATGLMDAYTSNMTGAYGNRKLIGSYSGPLLRIRRTSDNAELDISAGYVYTPQAWSTTNSSSEVSILGNLVTRITTNNDYRMVRTNRSINSPRYWEIELVTGSPAYFIAGISTLAVSNSYYPGQDTSDLSAGYASAEGSIYHHGVNNGSSGSTTVGTYATAAAGAKLKFAADPVNNKLYIGIVGSGWFNSGNPIAGTGYVSDCPGSSYPAVSMYNTGMQLRGYFTAASFTDVPPVGFIGWEDESNPFLYNKNAVRSFNATDSFFGQTDTLLHFQGADNSTTFTDLSPSHNTWSTEAGTPLIKVAQAKFGVSSLYLDGSSSISATLTAAGTGSITYEAYVYLSSTYVNQIFFGATTGGVQFFTRTDGKMVVIDSNVADRCQGAQVLPLNTWIHVAWCRANGVSRLFFNGTVDGIGAHTTDFTATAITIGGSPLGAARMTGYVAGARITRGSRYTTDFTPPTLAELSPPPTVSKVYDQYGSINMVQATGSAQPVLDATSGWLVFDGTDDSMYTEANGPGSLTAMTSVIELTNGSSTAGTPYDYNNAQGGHVGYGLSITNNNVSTLVSGPNGVVAFGDYRINDYYKRELFDDVVILRPKANSLSTSDILMTLNGFEVTNDGGGNNGSAASTFPAGRHTIGARGQGAGDFKSCKFRTLLTYDNEQTNRKGISDQLIYGDIVERNWPYYRFTGTRWYANANPPGRTSIARISSMRFKTPSTTYPTTSMTGANAPVPYAASASSTLSGGYYPYYAFDNDLTNASRFITDAVDDYNAWLQFYNGVGFSSAAFAIAPDDAVTSPNNNFFIDFRIEGSMTGTFTGEQARLAMRANLTSSDWTPSNYSFFGRDFVPKVYFPLIKFDFESDFSETSPTTRAVYTAGTPTISTTVKYDGAGSGFFDGASAIYCPYTIDMGIGSNKLRISLKFRPTSLAADGELFAHRYQYDGSNFMFCRLNTNGTVRFYQKSGGTVITDITTVGVATVNTWSVLTIERDAAGSVSLVIDGNSSVTVTTNLSSPYILPANDFQIGRGDNTSSYFTGYIDSFLFERTY